MYGGREYHVEHDLLELTDMINNAIGGIRNFDAKGRTLIRDKIAELSDSHAQMQRHCTG